LIFICGDLVVVAVAVVAVLKYVGCRGRLAATRNGGGGGGGGVIPLVALVVRPFN